MRLKKIKNYEKFLHKVTMKKLGEALIEAGEEAIKKIYEMFKKS